MYGSEQESPQYIVDYMLTLATGALCRTQG